MAGNPVGTRPTCPGSGPCRATCDGQTRTHCAASPGGDVACGATTCAEGWLTTSACGGNGACVPTTTNCAPIGCDATGTACGAGCTSNADCNDGTGCLGELVCDKHGSCVAGVPVICPDPGPCRRALGCDPATGECAYDTLLDGTVCDTGNPCTADACHGGACIAGPDVVTPACTALDQCHLPGTCNPATGQCTNPNSADDTPCNGDNACRIGDTCQAGICTGGTAVVCPPENGCVDVLCVPDRGCTSMPKPPFSSCTNGNRCIDGETCDGQGHCGGGQAVVCQPFDQCHAAGVCDPATGQCSLPMLSDNTACEVDHICCGGVCVGNSTAENCGSCGGGCSEPPGGKMRCV